MKKILLFFKNVLAELKKVKWPDKKYMTKYIVVTVTFIILLAIYFYGINVIVAFVKAWLK